MSKISFLLVFALLLAACGEKDSGGGTTPESGAGQSAALEAVFTSDAPADAQPAALVRAEAEDESTVTVTGKVKDFNAQRAVFTMVDLVVPSCADNPGDNCLTPWDYCCEDASHLAKHTVTVEVRGEDDRPVKAGLKGVKGLDHLDVVTVTGKVVRSGDNVSVVARSIHRK
jgi:hypothetical protein